MIAGTMPDQLARIVDAALSQRGVCELPKGSHSNRSPRIDEYRPRYRREELAKADKAAGKTVTAEAWCAWFVTWCWLAALKMQPLGRQIGGCHALAVRAMELDLWVPLSGKQVTPTLIAAYPGCAFVLLDKPINAGPSEGHTGIITGVSISGWEVSTIEGNSGDEVRAGKRELFDERVRGLIQPLGPVHADGDWPRGLFAGANLSAQRTR